MAKKAGSSRPAPANAPSKTTGQKSGPRRGNNPPAKSGGKKK